MAGFLTEQPCFLANAATFGRVVSSMDHPRVAVDNVSESAYRTARRTQLGGMIIDDIILGGIMDG